MDNKTFVRSANQKIWPKVFKVMYITPDGDVRGGYLAHKGKIQARNYMHILCKKLNLTFLSISREYNTNDKEILTVQFLNAIYNRRK